MEKSALQDKIGMEFPWEEIQRYRDSGRLLTLDIELSRLCNFNCTYCYSEAGRPLNEELNFDEICNVIIEGQTLGARKIVIVGGGEPLLYPHLKDIIELIKQRSMSVVIFTNGTGLDESLAKYFFSRQVGVMLKMNSMNPVVQNHLCHHENAYDIIWKAYNSLVSSGYTQKDYLLGIATIICKQNYDEIPTLWRWARSNNIIPYFETLTPQGRGKNYELCVEPGLLEKVFNDLLEIDCNEFGLKWEECHPPIAGMACLRHLYSCYIRSDGNVQPCSGVDISIGNLRDLSLCQILNTSLAYDELRNSDQLVKGSCSKCELKPKCHGCRGVAYHLTGDYLESDPYCWRSAK